MKRTSRTDSRQLALLVYLVDWRSALAHGSQATSVSWRVDIRGPKTRTIEELVRQIRSEKSKVGGLLWRRQKIELDTPVLEALEHVIKTTAKMQFQELSRNVLATWPVLHSNAESAREVVDLTQAASDYRASKGGSI